MRYILTLMLCLGFFASSTVQAQEEKKKVVIIKKKMDDNGKTTMERHEATGKDADVLLKKLKEDGTLEGIDIEVEIEEAKGEKIVIKEVVEDITVEKSMEDGKEVTKYKIVTNDNGEKKVMEWSGEGEMPAEMAEIMKKVEVNTFESKDGQEMRVVVEVDGDKDEKVVIKEIVEDITVEKSMEDGKEVTKYKIVTEDNGEKKVMEWSGEGEMPAEMAEIMKEVEVKTFKSKDGQMQVVVEIDDDEDGEMHEAHVMKKKMKKKMKMKKKNHNKVQLGVMIEDDSQGVVVSDIIKDSAADKTGLKVGDTILKVNDTYIFNMDMLIKTLGKFDKGDKVKLTYLRDGKEKKADVNF